MFIKNRLLAAVCFIKSSIKVIIVQEVLIYFLEIIFTSLRVQIIKKILF